MSKIVMTQTLCDAGYEPLAKEGPIYVANNGNPIRVDKTIVKSRL